MRFAFRHLPDPASAAVRARPIVDIVIEGLEVAPQACLIDSGAVAVRFGLHVAELCGLDLTDAPKARLAVGGGLVDARLAEVQLEISDGDTTHQWGAPVWFCEPWRPGFGLLGLTGFFDQFRVTIESYDEQLELTPLAD